MRNSEDIKLIEWLSSYGELSFIESVLVLSLIDESDMSFSSAILEVVQLRKESVTAYGKPLC